ncbi:MAG: toprim domain-containing protein, partial [Mesorhizobium sp.]
DEAIRALAAKPEIQLVAATDNNNQGDAYAGRLLALAEEAGCRAERLRPVADDWNADLKAMEKARGKEAEADCRMPAGRSRVKLRPAAPALDPPGRRGGCGGG